MRRPRQLPSSTVLTPTTPDPPRSTEMHIETHIEDLVPDPHCLASLILLRRPSRPTPSASFLSWSLVVVWTSATSNRDLLLEQLFGQCGHSCSRDVEDGQNFVCLSLTFSRLCVDFCCRCLLFLTKTVKCIIWTGTS